MSGREIKRERKRGKEKKRRKKVVICRVREGKKENQSDCTRIEWTITIQRSVTVVLIYNPINIYTISMHTQNTCTYTKHIH